MKSVQFAINWIHGSLEKRETDFGYGLFTNNNISKGERLVVFGGHVMTVDQESATEIAAGDYPLQIADDLVIGPAYETEIENSDFINHSCDPNSGFKGQIFLVAMRDIQAGEEICFDYAMALSGDGSGLHIEKCGCKSDQCRGVIAELDWQRQDLQEKYKGYFQFYLEEKIDRA